VAARRTRAAASNAGDRVPRCRIASVLDGLMSNRDMAAPTDGATNVEDASTVEGRIVRCAQ
jgi:hypothetical protein